MVSNGAHAPHGASLLCAAIGFVDRLDSTKLPDLPTAGSSQGGRGHTVTVDEVVVLLAFTVAVNVVFWLALAAQLCPARASSTWQGSSNTMY